LYILSPGSFKESGKLKEKKNKKNKFFLKRDYLSYDRYRKSDYSAETISISYDILHQNAETVLAVLAVSACQNSLVSASNLNYAWYISISYRYIGTWYIPDSINFDQWVFVSFKLLFKQKVSSSILLSKKLNCLMLFIIKKKRFFFKELQENKKKKMAFLLSG
jgi:hypothetical protein